MSFLPALILHFEVIVVKFCHSTFQSIDFKTNELFSDCNLNHSTVWYAFKLLCISQNLSENIHRAVCPRLVAGADRGWAKKNTKCRAGRPVCQIANLNLCAGIGLLRQAQGDIKIDFIAPNIGRALKGKGFENLTCCRSVKHFGIDGYLSH